MNNWYFKIKGKGKNDSEIFGFYVNCIFTTELSLSISKKEIEKDLISDSLFDISFEQVGLFSSFKWDKQSIQKEMNALSIKSAKNPNMICYSDFQTWSLRE